MRKATLGRLLVGAVGWLGVPGVCGLELPVDALVQPADASRSPGSMSAAALVHGSDPAKMADASGSCDWLLASGGSISATSEGYAMAYDDARGRLVLFRGRGYTSGDTWEWNGSVWLQRSPPTSPPARSSHAMVYDSARKRVVLFGGWNADPRPLPLADTWEWDGNTWIERTPPATPPARGNHAMAYDRARGRVVLFGGYDLYGSDQVLADTWEWDGSTWKKRISVTSPPGRADQAMAYDSARGRVVLFGGGIGSTYLADTWEWDGSTWAQRTVATSPTKRISHAMAYDSARERVVLFGGGGYGIPRRLSDTWVWDGLAWVEMTPVTSPSSRENHAVAYDGSRGRVVLFGGSGDSGDLADTWEWDGTSWTEKVTAADPPFRARPAMAYDSARGRVVLFGGSGDSGDLADTWEWDGSTWVQKMPVTSPPARSSHAMAYDSARERVTLFGGLSAGRTFLGDTWEWDGSTWVERARGPAGRSGHAMTYDAARGRVVLFGGVNLSGHLSDTWEWDGSTWLGRTSSPSPKARQSHALAFDSARRRTVLFGGAESSCCLADTWEWDGSRWEEKTPPTAPSGRFVHAMAYDIVQGRVLLFGGNGHSGYLDDTWVWDGSIWIRRTPAASPSARGYHVMAYDGGRQRVVLFGGIGSSFYPADTWEYGNIVSCASASSVMEFTSGSGGSTSASDTQGPPDGGAVSLGLYGRLVLRVEPPIMSGGGTDFIVYAQGANGGGVNENYRVEASDDNVNYVLVRECPGGDCQLDLTQTGLAYAWYIRITDLPPQEAGSVPPNLGADIDAISAVHCGLEDFCSGVPDGTRCDDGDACNTGDTCLDSACVGGPVTSCDDQNDCTEDSCNTTTGCVHAPDDTGVCSDANPCTPDACSGGQCVSNPSTDVDYDGVCDLRDNCPAAGNADQEDVDSDGFGDSCDNCPAIYNPDQSDVCDATSLLASANLSTDGFSADRIDGRDLFVFASTYALCPGDPGYNGLANLDRVPAGSGACVDAEDLHLFLNEFGKSR
jgi:hypothetical protein